MTCAYKININSTKAFTIPYVYTTSKFQKQIDIYARSKTYRLLQSLRKQTILSYTHEIYPQSLLASTIFS